MKKQGFVFPLILCSLFSACNNTPTDEPYNPIIVEETHVESISLNTNALTLKVGENYTFSCVINPNNATNQNLIWSSTNTTVATINDGYLVAKGEGKTTITVETEDGHKTDTCEVTVTKEVTPSKYTTIAEVKDYISKHPMELNQSGIGENKDVTFTIKGYAIAKFDLIKTKSSFGLNLSQPGKVVLADSTGYIGCASQTATGSLYAKVDKYACKDTSRYEVTGYISTYLNQPELVVTSFTYNEYLDVTWDYSAMTQDLSSITAFYEKAKNITYNCAGHGYGQMYTIKGLTCYNVESNGSGERYYRFTDGTYNLKVNAFNISQCSVNSTYDVTGFISLKNYSPIIVAVNFAKSTANPAQINYETVAIEQSIPTLKANKTSQDDTNTKYPNYIDSFKNIYKATGYMTTVVENGKYYIGIKDTFYDSSKSYLTGKDNARANYNLALIKNDNFWNVTDSQIIMYNNYLDVLDENIPVTVYYTQDLMSYMSGKTVWDIFLVPSSLPEIEK